MHILVINLDRRKDRLSHITKQLAGYNWQRVPALDGASGFEAMATKGWLSDSTWQDPLLKRAMTPGEVACFASHYLCWLMTIKSNTPTLILEDDASLLAPLHLPHCLDLLKRSAADVMYLGYREMGEASPHPSIPELVVPQYPYLTSSYCLTPKAALKLASSVNKQQLIPLDEFLPIVFGYTHANNRSVTPCLKRHVAALAKHATVKAVALREPIVQQEPRSILGTDIEPTGDPDFMQTNSQHQDQHQRKHPTVHVVTVATDPSKAAPLLESAKRFGITVTNIGEGHQWKGGDMRHPGGGHKISLMKSYLQSLSDDDVVLFLDGYDTCFARNLSEVHKRFFEMEADVVVAAEKSCWPDNSLSNMFAAQTDYKYPNSGVYMGRARSLKVLFDWPLADNEDDQLFLQKSLLRNKGAVTWRLDTEAYMFQCLSQAAGDVYVKENGVLTNRATNCCPCILHGNGVEADKQAFSRLVSQLDGSYEPKPILEFLEPADKPEVVGPELLSLDFLSRDACKKLIEMACANPQWKPMADDKFPGDELRIREISLELFSQLEKHFMEKVAPVVENYWWPLKLYGLRDAFVIRYSPSTQKSLACHHDASLVSTITYLNDDYTGGDTYFYRQKFSTHGTPVGKLVLWPGQVTHGHEGREVTSGVKYALVIWTCRRPGDINY